MLSKQDEMLEQIAKLFNTPLPKAFGAPDEAAADKKVPRLK
jgi:hypothetical protein